jgi:hypothetical protein
MARRGKRADQGTPIEPRMADSLPRRGIVLSQDEATALHRQLRFTWFPEKDYDTLHGLMERIRVYLDKE